MKVLVNLWAIMWVIGLLIETLRLLFPSPGVLGDLGTVSEVGFGLLGLAMGLGTGPMSRPDSGSEE